jgi:hypothetical protein
LQAHKRVKPINNIDNTTHTLLGTPSYMSKTAIVMVLLFMVIFNKSILQI